MDITILYPNTQTLTVYMLHRSIIYFIIISVVVLNSLVSDVKKGSLLVNSVILVVLSTHAKLASATARGAHIVKRENWRSCVWQIQKYTHTTWLPPPHPRGTPVSNGYGCKAHTSKGWGIRWEHNLKNWGVIGWEAKFWFKIRGHWVRMLLLIL